jgi:hypothetical protein
MIPAAIEHHRFDAFVLGALRDQLADALGAGEIAAVGAALLDRGRRTDACGPEPSSITCA